MLKQNIEGTKMKTTDYTLIENKIKKSKNDKVIGNENNKLVIQPVGIIVIEFLIKVKNYFHIIIRRHGK